MNKFIYTSIFIFLSFASNIYAWDNLENKTILCDITIENRELDVWGFKFIDSKKVKIYQISEILTQGELYIGNMFYEALAKKIYIGDNEGNPSFGHTFVVNRKSLLLIDTREENPSRNQCFNVYVNFEEEMRKYYKDKIDKAMSDNRI